MLCEKLTYFINLLFPGNKTEVLQDEQHTHKTTTLFYLQFMCFACHVRSETMYTLDLKITLYTKKHALHTI